MNSKLLNLDLKLLAPVFILIAISLMTLFSISPVLARSQAIFVGISFIAYIFFSNFNLKIFQFYSIPIYLISIVFLVLVFLIGIESRGSIRWVEILGFRIQFSEVLKPFLAISLASYLSEKRTFNFEVLIKTFLLLLPIVFLIFLQPDLGDALIYGMVVLCILIYLGFSFKYFLAIFAPLFLIAPIFWNILHDYQKQRILTFLNPGQDPLGFSYNVIQSVIAVGSGMFLGKGLGLGTQSGLKFLPERHTDFIFATLSEQLGFVGAIIILIAFGFLLYRIYKHVERAENVFAKTFFSIIFFAFLLQFFINIGMNIGILPIVGVTLPFVSYGGSSLLSNFIFLGLMVSVGKSEKRGEVLEIK